MFGEKIRLSVVTPDRKVVDEDVDEVVLPGDLGYFGVLPGHAPYLVRLHAGEADYRSGRSHQYLAIGGGFAEVLPDRVTVLADSAERPGEIRLEEAESEVARAEEGMRTAPPEEQDAARARLAHARIRVEVALRAAE